MYTHVNPSFTIEKWGKRGSELHGRVSMMETVQLMSLVVRKPVFGVSDQV